MALGAGATACARSSDPPHASLPELHPDDLLAAIDSDERPRGWRRRRAMRIAVVGGGVAGLSTAWALARMGHSVVVFEREAVGAPSQASSINSGFLHTEDTTDATSGAPDWNAVSSRYSMAVYKYAPQPWYLDTLCPAGSGAIEYSGSGMMLAAEAHTLRSTEEQMDWAKSCYPCEAAGPGPPVPE
eukprot:gene4972-5096_t